MSLAGEKVEHTQQADGLDRPAQQHQRPDLSPAGIHPVVQEGQKRISHRIKDAGERQQSAHDQSGDAIADRSRVTGQTDQEIDGHAVEGIERNEDDLPQLRLAVPHFIVLSEDCVCTCHNAQFLSYHLFLDRCFPYVLHNCT